jgi:hypothetical protein
VRGWMVRRRADPSTSSSKALTCAVKFAGPWHMSLAAYVLVVPVTTVPSSDGDCP